MTWKRKAYQVAAALDGTVLQWHPMGRSTYATVVVQTEDGLFHAYYNKCLYLSICNNISAPYEGAFHVTVGIGKGAVDRFEVVCNEPRQKDMKRILTAFLRLKHSAFEMQKVVECLSISGHEQMELLLEFHNELEGHSPVLKDSVSV